MKMAFDINKVQTLICFFTGGKTALSNILNHDSDSY